MEKAVNKLKCVWCLKGIVALDRRDVVKLLRRELAKRDARVRKTIRQLRGNRSLVSLEGALPSVAYNKACDDLLAALSGRKGTRE